MAIRLMREIDVPATPRDRVFRSSRLSAVVAVLICLAACAAMIIFHWPAPRLSDYFSGAILLLLFLLRRFVTARFHPSNWLVRMRNDGLYIHFRSYLNDHLSAEDPTVVFLPYEAIRSARLVREKVETPDPARNNTVDTQTLRWVEFELAIDPAPLATALATECARPAAMVKHWYGESSTLYRDYPILMQSPPFLRVKWQVVPRASVFLSALQGRVEIAPSVNIAADFSNLKGLPRDQQEQRLRDLDQRGHTIDAVYMATQLYGLNLTQATSFVGELRGRSQS